MPAETESLPTGADEALDTSATVGTEDGEAAAAASFLAELDGKAHGDTDDFAEAAKAEGRTPEEKPEATPEAVVETAEPVEPDYDALVAAAKPLDYTINGETKSVPWAQVIEGHGILIDHADAPKFQELAGKAEWFETKARELYDHNQQVEAAGGIPRIAELSEQVAMLDAAGSRLIGLLSDPKGTAILSLLAQNNEGQIVVDPARVQDLLEKIEADAKLARYAAKEKFGQVFTDYRTKQTTEQAAAGRDGMRSKAFDNVLTQAKTSLAGVTDEDLDDARVAFGSMLSALERPATAEEARALGLKAGDPVLGPERIEAFLRQRIARTTQRKSTTTTQAKATADNAARLRAAGQQSGGTRTGRPGAGKAPPPAAKGKIAPDDDGTYNFIMKKAMGGNFAVQSGE